MKILQLIPVTGWYSAYDLKDGTGPFLKTLVCLALIDENGFQKIVGFDGGDKITPAESQEHFVGYFHSAELKHMQQEDQEEFNDDTYELIEE